MSFGKIVTVVGFHNNVAAWANSLIRLINESKITNFDEVEICTKPEQKASKSKLCNS